MARLATCFSMAIAAQASGCSLVAAYPPVQDETTLLLCTNDQDDDEDGDTDCRDDQCVPFCVERTALTCADGDDDDDDGLVDCADPDCDGRCAELEATHCFDERDQDGDGLIDLADPGCWPFGRFEITQCGSVPGSDLAPSLDGTEREWSLHEGGRIEGGAIVLDGSELALDARHAEVLTGSLVGTVIRAEIDADPTLATVALILEALPPIEGFASFTAQVEASGVRLQSVTPGGHSATPQSAVWTSAPPPGSGHLILEAVLGADTQSVTATRDGVVVGSFEAPHRGHWGEAQPFSLRVEAVRRRADAPPVRITNVRVSRPQLDPCGHPVPDGLSGVLALTGTAVHEDEICVVGEVVESAARAMTSFVSTDAGRTWRTTVISQESLMTNPAGIAWDEDAQVYRAFDGTGARYESLDCLTWVRSSVGAALPDAWYRAYGLVRDETGAQVEELFIYPRGDVEVERVRVRLDGSSEVSRTPWLGPVPSRVHDDYFHIVRGDAGVSFSTISPIDGTTRMVGTYARSDRVGACDAYAPEEALVYLDATPAAAAEQSGGIVFICLAGAERRPVLAVAPFRVLTP